MGFSPRNKIPRCSAYAIGESYPVPASRLWSGSGSKVDQFVHVSTPVDTQNVIQIHTRVLSNLANRQTDRQTDNAGNRIYLLCCWRQIKDCARRFVLLNLKLTIDRRETSRGLFATGELLVESRSSLRHSSRVLCHAQDRRLYLIVYHSIAR